ncbi:hypothetical protein C8F04DRAFT_1257905 [Mycena alexandri]|uniref:Uncharacterized protein n=1 Tax=Mycena alexandri TaxID=1745969 RepID=A0AAD6SYW1_9AGAR|nr:hypothetical protein C8F04DRAFT_1257905 [Mycena alexandri]
MDWIPPPNRQRRDFICPQEDKDGASLSGQGLDSSSHSGPNGSGAQTVLTCTYEDGAGECSYLEDGTFSSGSSACPDGSPPPSSPTDANPNTSCHPNRQSFTPFYKSFASFYKSFAPSYQHLCPSPIALEHLADHHLPVFFNAAYEFFECSLRKQKQRSSAGKHFEARRRRRRNPEANVTVYQWKPPMNAPPPSGPISISAVAHNRQEYLMAQLRAVQKQLEAVQNGVGDGSTHLEEAMQQNEALRARIRMLEREMLSQWGQGLTDSPPEYLE